MTFRLETMCIRRMVPATILRPNSGVSWDFHHRRTKFFISHVWSPPKNILSYFWNQNPHVVGSLHRWQSIPFLCQKHLPSLQLACGDQNHRELHSTGMDDTDSDVFLHCCSWNTLTNALSSQKNDFIPGILPSSFNAYWGEFTAWVEGGLSYWHLDFAWGLSKVIQERSLMDGYKVIFESWEHWWGVSQLQQWWKRSLCVSFIPTEWDSRCFWSAQVSCQDDRCFWHRKDVGYKLRREPTTWWSWFQEKWLNIENA